MPRFLRGDVETGEGRRGWGAADRARVRDGLSRSSVEARLEREERGKDVWKRKSVFFDICRARVHERAPAPDGGVEEGGKKKKGGGRRKIHLFSCRDAKGRPLHG